MILMTGVCATLFALIHILIGRLSLLRGVPRSWWLSLAGGVAVSYVFLHILPELSTHQETFARGFGVSTQTGEIWVYLIALIGLALFYGLERAAKLSRKESSEDRVESHVLWIHIASFGLYNLLIGYLLLHREETSSWSLIIYTIAMALHFVTNDFGLREDQKHLYDRVGRWIIAAAVMGGWVLGIFITLPQLVIGLLFAFLAGGVVLNVLKEELPEERESQYVPFLVGAASYSALLLVL